MECSEAWVNTSTGHVQEGDVQRDRQVQMQWIVEWFTNWSDMQKDNFLKDLVVKAIPDKVCSLFDAMDRLKMADKNLSIFQCQMKLFDEWFQGWSDNEKNFFLCRLEDCDANFVGKLHEEIAATAGIA